MNTQNYSTDLSDWRQEAAHYIRQKNYAEAASLYEQAIESEPEIKSHYWHLGLLLLLQNQEAEAQTAWLFAMADATPDQVSLLTTELMQVLETEAERQELTGDFVVAWAIRQHMREIAPYDVNNLLHVIEDSIKLNTFHEEDLISLGVMELLTQAPKEEVNFELLEQVLQSVLGFSKPSSALLEFAEACLPCFTNAQDLIRILLPASHKIAYARKEPALAAAFLELCLRLNPHEPEILRHLASFYQNAGEYDKGIETAKLCYSLMTKVSDQIFANHLLLRGLMSAGGYWQEALEIFQRHEQLIRSLTQQNPASLEQVPTLRLFTSPFFLPYFRDDLKQNRKTQNGIARVCQSNVKNYANEQFEKYQQKFSSSGSTAAKSKPLKIGYLSHCLRNHSVGWLARWLFQHHDRNNFEIYSYFIDYKQVYDPLQEWYVAQSDYAYKTGLNEQDDALKFAEKIYEDKIDILIDLDSITLDISCEVMALKPAPVQATWLGWDASGLPTIDYFIVDPYVVPDWADEHYQEKLWRLPSTYIAVDGFEVGVPNLRREDLGIPQDAVIYLSGQRGYKRHIDTARLQMKILKEVPSSYFLIKGLSDQGAITKFFTQLAEEEGLSCDRLRFLPEVGSEAVHRANLGIADVVLDTYPYNGATTTLETLWMGIPIVTRVGEQFAARNSYTMMINAGITEGIAWTDEEYIDWGVRLGTDISLRQQVSWKLKQSRQTATLWNAKQFTRDMENAYEKMWEEYSGARLK